MVYLADLEKLVVVVRSVKERFLLEDHSGKHAAERPHVQRIIVFLEVHQQFGALEVARRHTHVVLHTCRKEK